MGNFKIVLYKRGTGWQAVVVSLFFIYYGAGTWLSPVMEIKIILEVTKIVKIHKIDPGTILWEREYALFNTGLIGNKALAGGVSVAGALMSTAIQQL